MTVAANTFTGSYFNTKNPPPPLALFKKKPGRFIKHKVILLVLAVILAWVGTNIVAGLYFLVFQTYAPITDFWHDTVPNSDLRHAIRDVGEGLLGGLLAQQVIWNHYHKRMAKPMTKLDRLEIKLHIANIKDDKPLSLWQLFATPWLAIVYAIPGFLIGFAIAWFFKHDVFNSQQMFGWFTKPVDSQMNIYSGGLWHNAKATLTDDWDKKLIGFGAAFFFGRRPARGVFDDLQLFFAERRKLNGMPLKKWHPPTFRARHFDLDDREITTGKITKDRAVSLIVLWTFRISVVLFLVGLYVMFFIAP